ncbi:MAG: LacI family DNA-binding transcriptional regulator [Chitinophagaceae bacterium]|nr:LacI family DNA-binding transcriptional regulator [Chitinophagaceae bacterium]MCW5928343.1 LacI family DNA-binding transcriptional regulator [Chitinophagaceae bacterium]
MQPTIKDIARRLGISVSTVSRALRGSSEINSDTRKLVLDLAKELNYSPNPIALSLKEKKSKVIGVIVPEIANYFCSAVIAGIEDIANSKGYHVMIFQSHESYERELINIHLLTARRVDGLLISVSNETKKGDHLKEVINGGIPVVMFDRICEEVDTPRVVTDDVDGAYQAASHLIKQGYKRIAHITMAPHLSVTRNRMRGYMQALKKHHIPYQKKWVVHCNFDYENMKQAVLKLLKTKPKPDSILVSGERIALSCFEVLKEMKLRIPEDIALAGFFDNPVSRFMNPPLTAVRQPTFDIGQSAASVLIKMIETNSLQHSYKTIELKTTIETGLSSLKK